jgi:hypothetical protein
MDFELTDDQVALQEGVLGLPKDRCGRRWTSS